MRAPLLPSVLLSGLLTACVFSPQEPPSGPDAGASSDAGELEEVEVANGWSWLPVEGSRCALGSRAGLALKPGGDGHELFLYVQGGGACWNEGTCAPSYRTNGPLCYYNPNALCVVDQPGGTQPTSVHVSDPDPFPADGGGALPGDLAILELSALLDRTLPDNPFREATFVYIPYCTGDLHVGRREVTYEVQSGPGAPVTERTIHFAGAANMARYLEVLKARFPNAERLWLFGVSAGGYGATFHRARVQAAFPDAEVHLLADSSPFIQPRHWDDWLEAWAPELPEGCADCAQGLPQVMDHVLETAAPDARVGLLAYRRDATIGWFLLADKGVDFFLNPDPTLAQVEAGLNALLPSYEATVGAGTFVLAGQQHVMLAGYGARQADGTYSAPFPSPDGSTDLRRWIHAWATGNAFMSAH